MHRLLIPLMLNLPDIIILDFPWVIHFWQCSGYIKWVHDFAISQAIPHRFYIYHQSDWHKSSRSSNISCWFKAIWGSCCEASLQWWTCLHVPLNTCQTLNLGWRNKFVMADAVASFLITVISPSIGPNKRAKPASVPCCYADDTFSVEEAKHCHHHINVFVSLHQIPNHAGLGDCNVVCSSSISLNSYLAEYCLSSRM